MHTANNDLVLFLTPLAMPLALIYPYFFLYVAATGRIIFPKSPCQPIWVTAPSLPPISDDNFIIGTACAALLLPAFAADNRTFRPYPCCDALALIFLPAIDGYRYLNDSCCLPACRTCMTPPLFLKRFPPYTWCHVSFRLPYLLPPAPMPPLSGYIHLLRS